MALAEGPLGLLGCPPAVISSTPFLCLVTCKPVGKWALWGPWRCQWSSLRPRPQSGLPRGRPWGRAVHGDTSVLSPRHLLREPWGARCQHRRAGWWGVNTGQISKKTQTDTQTVLLS